MILWRLPDFVWQKMMLPATRSSCLKYIHTNISIYVGTGTRYIDTLNDLYPKTSTGNTRHIAASATFVVQTRQYTPRCYALRFWEVMTPPKWAPRGWRERIAPATPLQLQYTFNIGIT
jgi:hypothetical protein